LARTAERVEEECWQTADERQWPDDAQYGDDSPSTTDDVRVDRMNDRYISTTTQERSDRNSKQNPAWRPPGAICLSVESIE